MGGDVLDMSLDEIIKTQKAQKQKVRKPIKVLAGKWNMKKKQGYFKGSVSRTPQRNNAVIGRGGRKNHQGVSPIHRPANFPTRTRPPRMGRANWKQGRINRQFKNGQPRNNSRYFNQSVPPLMNTSSTFGTRQQKLIHAIKSVRRARMMLRKLRQTAPFPSRKFNFNRPRKVIASRVKLGKFGFVTTRRDNLEERRAIIRNKIVRAQMARTGVLTPVVQSLPGPNRSRGRSPRGRYGRGRQEPFRRNDMSPRGAGPSRRNDRSPRGARTSRRTDWSPRGAGPTKRNDWSPRGTGRGSRGYREEFGSNRQRWNGGEDDAWNSVPQTRQIQNDLYDPYSNAQIERQGNSSRGLNQDLQRKISRIQEQGRMTRGDEKYEPINEANEQFRRNIVSSSAMSLSDRFKMFMK